MTEKCADIVQKVEVAADSQSCPRGKRQVEEVLDALRPRASVQVAVDDKAKGDDTHEDALALRFNIHKGGSDDTDVNDFLNALWRENPLEGFSTPKKKVARAASAGDEPQRASRTPPTKYGGKADSSAAARSHPFGLSEGVVLKCRLLVNLLRE